MHVGADLCSSCGEIVSKLMAEQFDHAVLNVLGRCAVEVPLYHLLHPFAPLIWNTKPRMGIRHLVLLKFDQSWIINLS